MIEFEEYRLKLNDLKPKLEALAVSLNLEGARNELERYHAMRRPPAFGTTRSGLKRSWCRRSSWRPSWRSTVP